MTLSQLRHISRDIANQTNLSFVQVSNQTQGNHVTVRTFYLNPVVQRGTVSPMTASVCTWQSNSK